MSDTNLESLTITIGDQSFRIRVAPEEHARYVAIGEEANAAYQNALDKGAFAGAKSMAMALFQTTAELEATRDQLRRTEGPGREKLKRLIERIDEVTASASDSFL